MSQRGGGPGEGYDVIGDVHGQYDKLVGLLRHLGYAERDGLWSHLTRRAVFVGDLIDRGEGQLEVLRLARTMVEAGTGLIVMGNHEFNAIAWATPHPSNGDYLRPRLGAKGAKNYAQHAVFLTAVGADSGVHREWVDWFRTLPLWLDLGGLRAVHACWHEPSMDVLRPLARQRGGSWCMDDTATLLASIKGTPEYEALECLLKGPEVALPDGFAYLDKEGHERRKARIAWWRSDTSTFLRAALIPLKSKTPAGEPCRELPDDPVTEKDVRIWPVPSYRDNVPVVVGHYWSKEDDLIHDPRMICVDLSAAEGLNPLAAYRWSGETTIDAANLDWAGTKG
jgi:hypothetical protein